MPVLRSSAASPIVSAVRATRVAGNSVAAASRPISTAGRPKTNYLTSRYTPSVRTTQPRAPVLATAARSRDRSAQPLRSAHGATAITAPPTAKVPQPSTAKVPQPGARSVSDLKKAIAEVKVSTLFLQSNALKPSMHSCYRILMCRSILTPFALFLFYLCFSVHSLHLIVIVMPY